MVTPVRGEPSAERTVPVTGTSWVKPQKASKRNKMLMAVLFINKLFWKLK
jgi:hypothetical protein